MTNAVRWGILGCAGIARKNWEAIRLSGNGIVTAVASRDASRAAEFVDQCQAEAPFETKPSAVGGYDALLARPDVDAVYIPLPTGIRGEWVRRAASAGKHVLCEKPCAGTASELRGMIEACAAARVQFMDGVMFQHSRRLDSIRALLDDRKSFGEIRRVDSAFSFLADDGFARANIRGQAGLEPLGCLGDLGWYNIRFTLWALGWQKPRRVEARCHRWIGGSGLDGVPAEVSAHLDFRDGVSASFYCSFAAADQQWAHISGTKAGVRVADFVLPFDGRKVQYDVVRSEFVVRGCDFRMKGGLATVEIDEAPTRDPGAQESRLFSTFAGLVLTGRVDPHWSDIAMATQEVTDACMESIRLNR